MNKDIENSMFKGWAEYAETQDKNYIVNEILPNLTQQFREKLTKQLSLPININNERLYELIFEE